VINFLGTKVLAKPPIIDAEIIGEDTDPVSTGSEEAFGRSGSR
jgi:hypothetical protein